MSKWAKVVDETTLWKNLVGEVIDSTDQICRLKVTNGQLWFYKHEIELIDKPANYDEYVEKTGFNYIDDDRIAKAL